MSACKAALGLEGFLFVGVESFGAESNVRTDLLLGMAETTTNEAVGAMCLWYRGGGMHW